MFILRILFGALSSYIADLIPFQNLYLEKLHKHVQLLFNKPKYLVENTYNSIIFLFFLFFPFSGPQTSIFLIC